MKLVSEKFAQFAVDLNFDAVPPSVVGRVLHAILDGTGIALAASRAEFATQSLAALGPSEHPDRIPVIGMGVRLSVRDAAFLNGILVHGLDFDDTHLAAAIHPTASLLPTILAVGFEQRQSARQMVEAYIVGLEASARLGLVGGIAMRTAGRWHPTSVLGIFGCVLAAGRLMKLSPQQLVMAQGLALSMSSGVLVAEADGAENKRLHAGWAAQSAIAAARFAQAGMKGTTRPYDGQRGVFRAIASEGDPAFALLANRIDDLGTTWECENLSVKPIPACHVTHGCADAAAAIRNGHDFSIAEIERVVAWVPAAIVPGVCEPLASKRRPPNGYAAQFSIPYVVAANLVRDKFGFSELEPSAVSDPEILRVASLVEYRIDENSTFPKHRTGEVHVFLKGGSMLSHREPINRGHPDRPLSFADISAKFMGNASLVMDIDEAARIEATILSAPDFGPGRSFVEAISGQKSRLHAIL